MSDPQYDTEFWFNATLYTAYDWRGDFGTVEDAREAFDAWLSEARAEAWDEGADAYQWNVHHATGPKDEITNPYREGAE